MHHHFKAQFKTPWTRLLIHIIALLACSAVKAQVSPASCGELKPSGQFGPYDYRTDKSQLSIVEPYHFPPVVEALIAGSAGSTSIGGNIAYTLRAFPNHHKALMAMMRYGEKTKSPQPEGAPWPVECFFERALRFRPDDIIVRMIYASFLTRNARQPEALQQLARVAASAGSNAFTHQNLGLVYSDLKEYEKSRHHAHKAIALGLVRLPLREQLQSVGQWIEPAQLSTSPDLDGTVPSPTPPLTQP